MAFISRLDEKGTEVGYSRTGKDQYPSSKMKKKHKKDVDLLKMDLDKFRIRRKGVG